MAGCRLCYVEEFEKIGSLGSIRDHEPKGSGAALGLALGTRLDALVYGVNTAEPAILAGAVSTVFAAPLFAALAPAAQTMRSSPVTIPRVD